MDARGVLSWDAPPGEWEILRFGCTVGDHSRVSTASQGWSGYALDVLDEGAFKRYWDAVVTPLINDAGAEAGKALKYLHTDSWEMGLPGQQYFAGTHMNPATTWWPDSAPLVSYINRSQFLLQRGLPVSDVTYYYGDHVPNFTQLRVSDPAKLGAGYDYDVVTAEVILTRMSVRNGRIVLPHGVSYRVLVLPERAVISLPVLRKLQVLVAAGATIIGPQPRQASGLTGFPQSDREVQKIGAALWNRKPGAGRVTSGRTVRQVLEGDGVPADFEASGSGSASEINYIHRREGDTEIDFVASRSKQAVSARCTFRVSGRAPELWNAVSGERRFASAYTQANGRTTIPLDFAPCGSWFVLFRSPARAHPPTAQSNSLRFSPRQTWGGPWEVSGKSASIPGGAGPRPRPSTLWKAGLSAPSLASVFTRAARRIARASICQPGCLSRAVDCGSIWAMCASWRGCVSTGPLWVYCGRRRFASTSAVSRGRGATRSRSRW